MRHFSFFVLLFCEETRDVQKKKPFTLLSDIKIEAFQIVSMVLENKVSPSLKLAKDAINQFTKSEKRRRIKTTLFFS